MISISKQYTFDSAHQLDLPECTVDENHAMFGKCNRLHGHTYYLTVEITGSIDPETGMILNYFDLDEFMKPYVDDVLDHRFMNDVFPGLLTTAENMSEAIAISVAARLKRAVGDHVYVKSITLSETPKTTAKWQA